jgi:hypothetical protein
MVSAGPGKRLLSNAGTTPTGHKDLWMTKVDSLLLSNIDSQGAAGTLRDYFMTAA